MQSRPADQLYDFFLQVKIAGQNGFDVSRIRALLHRAIELNNAAELIATAIICVGQYELRVVLSGHVTNLRPGVIRDCEPEHKFPVKGRQSAEI
jgi:hypothetical protein